MQGAQSRRSAAKAVALTLSSVVLSSLALPACATNEADTSAAPVGTDPAIEGGNDTTLSTGVAISGQLQGTGASSMKMAQDVWRSSFQQAHPNVTINYSPEGSGAGRTAFKEGGAAFAGSDRPLNDEELATTNFVTCAAGTSPINLPVYISPIVIIFNIPDVDELNLDAPTLAKIFRRDITNWNDPAIAKLNSSITLPDLTITPVHRADNSGTTENFTTTLAQTAPDVWTDPPSGDWPAALGGEAGQKSSGMISAVASGKGAIGYADESGVPADMTGAFFTSNVGDTVGPTAQAAAQVLESSDRLAGRSENDWALTINRTGTGYPFILVSYMIACEEYADPAVGQIVNAYAVYLTSSEGQDAAHDLTGSAPLAGTIGDGVRAAAAAIK